MSRKPHVIVLMADHLRVDCLDMERDAGFCPCRWRRFDRDRGWLD
jgi:hypothetical protein